MSKISNYLDNRCSKIYKLLPMRESQLIGEENHLERYLEKVIINMRGATYEYERLGKNERFLDMINNLQFLRNNNADIAVWKNIVLDACTELNNLSEQFKEAPDE